MTLSKFGMKGRVRSLCRETVDPRDEVAEGNWPFSAGLGDWVKDQLWLRLDEASQNIPNDETCVG